MVLTAVAICVSIGLALGIGFYVSLAKQKID
jgi:ABC-type proline/glycine betaine transport system permease subunit